MSGPLSRSDCAYAAMYCEENAWQLAGCSLLPAGHRDVLVISNPGRSVALGAQRAGGGGVVLWDYHVVLAVSTKDEALVFDLDSVLPFPCPLEQYVHSTFGDPSALPQEFRALIRWVDAGEYARNLFSDRSHMRRPDGGWSAPPPRWPAPVAPERRWRLVELIDMKRVSPGRVVRPNELAAALKR